MRTPVGKSDTWAWDFDANSCSAATGAETPSPLVFAKPLTVRVLETPLDNEVRTTETQPEKCAWEISSNSPSAATGPETPLPVALAKTHKGCVLETSTDSEMQASVSKSDTWAWDFNANSCSAATGTETPWPVALAKPLTVRVLETPLYHEMRTPERQPEKCACDINLHSRSAATGPDTPLPVAMAKPHRQPETCAWEISSNSRSAATGPETPLLVALSKPHTVGGFETSTDCEMQASVNKSDPWAWDFNTNSGSAGTGAETPSPVALAKRLTVRVLETPLDYEMRTPERQPEKRAWEVSCNSLSAASPETPLPVALPKPHTNEVRESPMKKLKFSGSEVEQHVRTVNYALGQLKLRSKPCKELLEDITFFSLGPMEAARHELQKDASALIGPELERVQVQDEHRIRELERVIAEKRRTLEQLTHSESHAESEKASKQEAISHQQRVINDASMCVRDAFTSLQAATDRKRGYEMEMQTITKIKQEVEELKTKHFDPLNCNERTRNTLGNSEVSNHIEEVRKFLVGPHPTWGKYREEFGRIINCEVGLLDSFCTAASHYRSERGAFCIEAMEGVEGIGPKLLSLLQRATGVYAQMHQKFDSFGAEVMHAESAHTSAQKELELAKQALAAMKVELGQGVQQLAQIKKQVHDLEAEIQRLKDELACLRSRSIRQVSIAALASYRWLMPHQVSGYEPPAPKETHLSTYTPVVQDKMRAVSRGLNSIPMLPASCTNMLMSCVLHGLGPVPNDRSDPQGAASQLVGKALGLKEVQLHHDIIEQIPCVGSTTMNFTVSIEEILPQAGTDADKRREEKETAQGMIAMIVHVKEADLNQLQSKQHGLNQSLERARYELNLAQENLERKSNQTSEANDRYKDFCVLHKGVSKTEAKRLFGPLGKFFKTIPSEESLVCGFWHSAAEHPEERGVICHQIMSAVENDIVTFKRRLEGEEHDLEVIKQNRSEHVKCLEQEVVSLQEQIRRVNAELAAARDLSMRVKELDTFRSEVLSAYRWLLLRPVMAT